MPVCSNCKNEWSWVTSMKVGLKFQRGVECEFCGEKQFQTQTSMRKASLCNMAPLLILPLIIFFDFSVVLTFVCLLVLQLIVLTLFPFTLELSPEQEPLW